MECLNGLLSLADLLEKHKVLFKKIVNGSFSQWCQHFDVIIKIIQSVWKFNASIHFQMLYYLTTWSCKSLSLHVSKIRLDLAFRDNVDWRVTFLQVKTFEHYHSYESTQPVLSFSGQTQIFSQDVNWKRCGSFTHKQSTWGVLMGCSLWLICLRKTKCHSRRLL